MASERYPATVESVLDVSDDERLAPRDNVRRSSKTSVSSAASSLIELDDAILAALNNEAEAWTGVSVMSSNRAGEMLSPRINELRLQTENLSGIVGGEGAVRASPRVGLRNSPGSPRKMLVSTPVSGNFDFHGIMPPHHARRLSNRSASSPRLVLSGLSPKLSPTGLLVPKISPRDAALNVSTSSTPTKGTAARQPLSPATGPTMLKTNPASRRTSSGTLFIPPPASALLFESLPPQAASTETKSEALPIVKSTTRSSEPNVAVVTKVVDQQFLEASKQPSLQARREKLGRLQLDVTVRGRSQSRDWESEGTVGGDSSTNASLTATRDDGGLLGATKRNIRRRGRRASDPGLPLSEAWSKIGAPSRTSPPSILPETEETVSISSQQPGESVEVLRPVPVRAEESSSTMIMNDEEEEEEEEEAHVEKEYDDASAVNPIREVHSASVLASGASPGTVAALVAAIEEKTSSFKGVQDLPRKSGSIGATSPLPSPSPPFGQPTSHKAKSSFAFPTLSFAKSPMSRVGHHGGTGGASGLTSSHSKPFPFSSSSKSKDKSHAAGVTTTPSPAPSMSPPKSSFTRRLVSPPTAATQEAKAAMRAMSPSPKNLAGTFFTRSKPLEHTKQQPMSKGNRSDQHAVVSSASPPPVLGLQRAVSLDEHHLSSKGISTLPGPSRATSHTNISSLAGIEEIAIRKVQSGSGSTLSTSSTSHFLQPPPTSVLREKSPSSSPTTRTKRRASFNLVGFDATIAALKLKFKRKNSSATRESTSTPNSPLLHEDRRTMPSGSITSVQYFSDESEEGLESGRHPRSAKSAKDHHTPVGGRFYLDERRNSEAMDLEDEDLSEAEEERLMDAHVHKYAIEEEDLIHQTGLSHGSVEDILKAANAIESRNTRNKVLESLFFSAADLLDPSGEQMTIKLADHVEDVRSLDALEMWLVKFRAMEKLRFYDPFVSARVREVVSAFANDSARELLNTPRASTLHHSAGEKMAVKDHAEEEDRAVDSVVYDSEDIGSVIKVDTLKPRRRSRSASTDSSSSSSSSSSEDEMDTEEEHAQGDTKRMAREAILAGRLLRRLNRSESEVNEVPAQSNDWETDFEEQRGKRGSGVHKRRHSESEATLSSSVPLAEDLHPLRRAASLPYLFLWSEGPGASSATPGAATRTRREYSTSSFGSFSARSGSQLLLLSPRSNKQRDAEEEELCVMEMLAYVVAPPLSIMASSGSVSTVTTATTTLPGSPPPVETSDRVNKQILLAQLRASTSRRHSIETLSEYDNKLAHSSASSLTAHMNAAAMDHSSFDVVMEEQLSPKSAGVDARAAAAGGLRPSFGNRRAGHKRQHSNSQGSHQASSTTTTTTQQTTHHHHSKQPSTSSLQAFLSGPRRTAVSSSFSSFVEADTLSLPDKALRGDIKRYDPEMVARQLMFTMYRCAYYQLTAQALRTVEARKRDEAVQRMVRFFEVLSNWPVTEILGDSKRTASDRIDDFGWFVCLASECREMGNYHAVFAIVGGLQSPLLVWVADIAHRKDKRSFKSLQRLVRTENNYRVYNADLSKRDLRLPCIPYLGLLNRSLLALQCDSPIFVDEEQRVVNFVRIGRIRQVIAEYLKWQRNDTGIPQNGVYLDPCIRKALAESMSRSVLDYQELSLMSSQSRKAFVKNVRQRTFHRARVFGHHIVRADGS